MGWVETLKGHVVALDMAPLIYFVEEHERYLDIIDPFFVALSRHEFSVVTSMITCVEVLVQPFRHGKPSLAQQYHDLLFNTDGIETIMLSQSIAEKAAQLRASYKLRTPDAIQVATAVDQRASFFITNDKGLAALPEVQVIVLDDIKEGP